MTTVCPSALTRSMYVDGELAAADVAALEAHLDSCAACRTRIAALRGERLMLRELFAGGEELEAIPPLRRGFGRKELLLGFAGVAAVGWIASTAWAAVDAAVPSELRWLSPLDSGSLLDSFFNLVVFLTREGSSMLTSITQFAAAAVLVSLLGWGGAALLKRGAGNAVMLSALLLVLALPQLGHAFEIRRSDDVTTLAAGETVEDTLLAVGQTVSIDGDVNGDLLAFGQHVTVRGNIAGDVISGAETIDIQGTVGGNVFGGARAVTLAQARIRGNLYSGAREVSLAADGEIKGNAIAFADSVNFAGGVGLDLKSFARDLVVRGNVQRNVEGYGATITVLPPARVGGNLTAHVDNPAGVRVTPGTVIGTVDTQVDDRFGAQRESRNKYLTAGFYTWQAIRLGAAFTTGLLLLWLFPGLQTLSIANGVAALRAAGIGLVTAVTLPAVVFIACVTVIGIPLGIIIAALWVLGLYFAKTVVAQMIGRQLFKTRDGATPHFAATLLAGLVIVLIAVNLPWIGWLVGLVLTLIGLGLIVAYLSERSGRSLA
jgi:cytoskeletal protein CcmA (bactofilin family)